MRHIDITLDLETCSLSSHAAIMQMAAVAWDRHAASEDMIFFGRVTRPGETPFFQATVDLNSQFVEGLWDFSQSTSEWWCKRSPEARRAVSGEHQLQLEEALAALDLWIRKVQETYRAETFCLWCQGTDFDIPILRYAASRTGCDGLLPVALHHKFFRDCRTAVYEMTSLWLRHTMPGDEALEGLLADPLMAYRVLPALPEGFGAEGGAHTALYDSIRSSWYVWQAMHKVMDLKTDCKRRK